MPSELRDLLSDIEVSLVDTVARLEQAETAQLLVGVLDLERRVDALHDALASVADGLAQRELVTGQSDRGRTDG